MNDSKHGSNAAIHSSQSWRFRGLGMGVVLVAARIALSLAIEHRPLHATALRFGTLATVVALAIAWSTLDGRRDRARNPDPEHGADLTMTWLIAGLLAGLVAGVVAWGVGRLFELDLGNNSMLFELTSGAAWSMLLVLIAATIGVTAGRLSTSRLSTSRAPTTTPA